MMNIKVFKHLFLFTVVLFFFVHRSSWGLNLEVHIIDVWENSCLNSVHLKRVTIEPEDVINLGGYSHLKSIASDGETKDCCQNGNVLFSEVLYDSWVSGEAEGEWIELYNTSTSIVDLSLWRINDIDRSYTIPNGTTIGPQCYLIISDGQSVFYQKYGCYPHLSNLQLQLNNNGGYLILKNSKGTVIDQVAWESGGSNISGWGSTSIPYANDGRSIVRADLNNDTDTYADWMNNSFPNPGCNGIPQINISSTQINFELNVGDTDSQNFSISNSGCGMLHWMVTDDKGWITCSPTLGTNSGLVTVTVNTDGLSPDTYTGTVTVTDPNAANSPRTVNITLIVNDIVVIPKINLSTTELNFELNAGDTDSQDFSISNSGNGTLNWTVTDDKDWITCSPTSGTNSGLVNVYVDTNGLSPDTYTGTVTVTDPNASNSPRTVNVTLIVEESVGIPEIALSRTHLYFGASGSVKTSSQSFLVSNNGSGTLNWIVTDNANWINCSPINGTNTGVINVSVNSSGLLLGTYTGKVYVNDSNAINSPQTLSVTLKVYGSGATSYPFGSFETPITGSTVRSSIPVTGWVVDDIEVINVKIYNGTNYVGDAVFVEGARPDVEAAYPGYPKNYQAGWGYMMLTNFLPNGGNGTYTFYAKATDAEGHQVTLGSKTINIDNANAVKPFGAIDTPGQGGTASGSQFVNFGWVLTPLPKTIPIDGSTITVWVDGVSVGHPVYNQYRADIATLFPGYNNSNGAVGYFYLDTTTYENGVHTIQWTAKDSAGNRDGIGSRYFTIQNTSSSRLQNALNRTCSVKEIEHMTREIIVENFDPISIKRGYNENINLQTIYPDEKGTVLIQIDELERLEIYLGNPSSHYNGYLKVGKQLRLLPIGSTLDSKKGVFYWQPGPGFIGDYEFVFIQNQSLQLIKKNIFIKIVPRFQ